MRLSECGAKLICEFESFVDHVYLDSVGVETIGFGETDRDVIGFYRHRTITEDQARQWLREAVDHKYGAAVVALGLDLNQAQFDALTSFVYNLGVGILNPGRSIRDALDNDHALVPAAMRLYDKAGGKTLPGLTRRRNREAVLFATGDYGIEGCPPKRRRREEDER